MIRTLKRFAPVLLAATCSLSGCSEDAGVDLADVSGVVTNTQGPVSGATVEFHPTKGRPSYATTGSDGRYELKYSEEETGAVVGPHSIRVTVGGATASPASDNEEVLETPAKTVALPGQMDVTAGENTIDIDLANAAPISGGMSRGGGEVLERPTR